MLKGIVWLCVSNFAHSQQPQHAPPSQGPCRDASEPGVQESRESHRHHLPTVARHVPVDEHQVHGGDWLPLWLGLRTSPFGKSLTGGPWVLLSDFTPGKVAAAYLMGGGCGALDSRVNTPWPCLQNHIFQTHSSSKPLIRPPGGEALLLGNVVLSARSAPRPVRGDFIRSSPICLRKHPQGPPIKVLLFFLGRCLF